MRRNGDAPAFAAVLRFAALCGAVRGARGQDEPGSSDGDAVVWHVVLRVVVPLLMIMSLIFIVWYVLRRHRRAEEIRRIHAAQARGETILVVQPVDHNMRPAGESLVIVQPAGAHPAHRMGDGDEQPATGIPVHGYPIGPGYPPQHPQPLYPGFPHQGQPYPYPPVAGEPHGGAYPPQSYAPPPPNGEPVGYTAPPAASAPPCASPGIPLAQAPPPAPGRPAADGDAAWYDALAAAPPPASQQPATAAPPPPQ